MLKQRKPRRSFRVRTSPATLAIPDKLYFRIGEVSRLAQTKPYVLRYWETEFPTLKPVKSSTGHRLYRKPDVEMVLRSSACFTKKGSPSKARASTLQGIPAKQRTHCHAVNPA